MMMINNETLTLNRKQAIEALNTAADMARKKDDYGLAQALEAIREDYFR